MEKMFIDINQMIDFIHAGKSTFTIVSKKTNKHYTYKMKMTDKGNVFFVSVMFGHDNETSYKYIGYIKWNSFFPNNEYHKGKEVFDWFYRNLSNDLLDKIDVYHSGKCGKCNRKLTTPESIETGLGPICRKIYVQN